MNEIARRLKDKRTELSYSQDAFEPGGVNQRKVSRWESGEIPDALTGIAYIARRLEVSTDYLLGLTDDPTPAGGASEIQRLFDRLSADRQADLVDTARMYLAKEDPAFQIEDFMRMVDELAGDEGLEGTEIGAAIRRVIDEEMGNE